MRKSKNTLTLLKTGNNIERLKVILSTLGCKKEFSPNVYTCTSYPVSKEALQVNVSLKDYWEYAAEDFSAFYDKEKSALRKLIDRVFRRSMKERFDLTLEECGDVRGKKILDIGCGSGRVVVELAKRGAEVVGIDFSRKMIDLASSLAGKYDLTSKCRFVYDDFLEHVFDMDFDISLALGFFDYLQDPVPYLRKMKLLTGEKCMMSFCSTIAFQAPIRKIWLNRRKVNVYFYTKEQIKCLLSNFFPRFRIRNIYAGYFCVAWV